MRMWFVRRLNYDRTFAMLPSRIDKSALWKEHSEKFTCEHSVSELRERTVKGGGKQFVRQCLRCGDAITSPIKTDDAIAQCGGVRPQSFDENVKAEWDKRVKESADKIQNADDSEFWKAYEKYLTSPKWETKRKQVLKRAGGLCEGCREREATQVHHLTYAHVGEEFLFELVAVCEICHDKLHEETA
jgi:5-methylcytosine-specific restriction endonuclease McrA